MMEPETPPARMSRPPEGAGQQVDEQQDFGVRPTNALRPTEQMHAQTPTSVPGGRVVSTAQLADWIKQAQGNPEGLLLLHVIGSPVHLPGAVAAAPASQGGSFDDQVQRDYSAFLQQATGGDTSRRIVVYCQGVMCWGSYNAALRAIKAGYRNVHWYRGGIEAWGAAGLPLRDASKPQQ